MDENRKCCWEESKWKYQRLNKNETHCKKWFWESTRENNSKINLVEQKIKMSRHKGELDVDINETWATLVLKESLPWKGCGVEGDERTEQWLNHHYCHWFSLSPSAVAYVLITNESLKCETWGDDPPQIKRNFLSRIHVEISFKLDKDTVFFLQKLINREIVVYWQ